MPVPTTADDFLALVRKSGVVASPTLDEFERGLSATTPPPKNAKRLAATMIGTGLITHLQAGLLLQGKWRNFILCSKYRLLELLGRGGMGQVYLCEHTRMRRKVAVKILPPDKAADPVLFRRFEREARAVAALDHPNIVRAYDLDSDGELHFLVMEFVDGAGLDEVVRRSGPLPVGRACNYIGQAALGLQHAHESHLVHRDVKPANLLIDRTGRVKVLDLGLARFFNDCESLTGELARVNLVGTADYLAPEQATNGHAVDIRADVYGLGATFYYLLAGRPLFPEGSVAQRLMMHQVKRPEPIRKHRPDVPVAVARLIARMLAKDPADRPQTPGEVAAALAPWSGLPPQPPGTGEMPKLCRAARASDTPRPSKALRLDARPAPILPRRFGSRWLWLGVLGMLLGAAGWLGWSALNVLPEIPPAGSIGEIGD